MTHFLLRIIKLSFYLKLSPSEGGWGVWGGGGGVQNAQLFGARSKGWWHTATDGDNVRHGGITVTGNKQHPNRKFGVMGQPRYSFYTQMRFEGR